jgi:hypothetical protein
MSVDNEWQRLQQLYAGLSDDELLNLAASRDELTEVAQQAFAAEMNGRGLALPVDEAEADVTTSSVEEAEDQESSWAEGGEDDRSEAEKDPSLVELKTFGIATEAEKALHELDDHGIPVTMESALRRLTEDGPRIKTNWLTIFVEKTRQEEARSVLRKTMGLFPVLAPDEIGHLEEDEGDEEVLLPVGTFDVKADAELAHKALTDAGVWFSAESDDWVSEAGNKVESTTLQVRAKDLDRAIEVVEAAFGEAV